MNTRDEICIIVAALFGCICISITSYCMGKDAMKREAVVAGHALWAYDEHGNPKFHWKEQQTIIGEYLGLRK
jgi:hypothetical protein